MSEDLIHKRIMDEDKVKLKYKQKLNSLKQYYGIDFDIEYFKDNNIKDIYFSNLEYNNLKKISINYNNTTNEFDYINYEFDNNTDMKNINHKSLYNGMIKKFRLKLMVTEINKIHNEYVNELKKISDNYKENITSNDYVKTLQINNNETDN